jgi:pimeloyl-ACP methyl ester carboxylesterase
MNAPAKALSESHDVSAKVTQMLQTRTKTAIQRYGDRVRRATERTTTDLMAKAPVEPWHLWTSGPRYVVDAAQRSILLLDTLRQRGNNFLEHERQGLPPVLRFEYEVVMDGRSLERPVNYALLRIVPPAGVTVDERKRPYVIIDPRGGHGPGIGGFKDDSQVGVALHAGHPVYFVVFHPNPEPGQTLLDVSSAERQFVARVRALHPHSAKPAIVGNCQAGWAAMMLAAAHPDDTGPLVIVGAPMSYWGGAWSEGEGDNPMRYSGGLLGGTWLSSFVSDLGAGKFDGAWLVQNFENLNPANTFWDKYYNVFANVDTETARFLEFERWWGGYFLMNTEEIEWITQNLFVGNKLRSGTVKADAGVFDLREIKVPIVLFASMGDNITPPQQAFNWVADVYGSTEEIKARGQVIVGLMHQDIGHLGIFVAGKVAKKEHAQIVSVLESIEALPPGLYGMQIAEKPGRDGAASYDVNLVELRLEDVAARLNRFKREDERPFEAMNTVSEFNQRAYELFGRPLVKAMSNEYSAKLARLLHPLRLQRWAFSDLNPALVLARAGRAGGEGPTPGAAGRRSGAQGGIARLRARERVAGLPARAARCRRRGELLPDLRQSLGVLLRRRARSGQGAARGSCARALVRQEGARRDRQGRLSRSTRACRLPHGARGRSPSAVATRARARPARRLSRAPAGAAARPGAPNRRRAGDHRAL